MKVLLAGHDVVERLLPLDECILVMRDTFDMLARGEAMLPLRGGLRQPDGKGVLAWMPAYLGKERLIGGKFITVFGGNRDTHFESHQGAVLLFESENGRLLAILDAASITAIRTAACSALATDLLATDDSSDLAILGSGTQAYMHLRSMRVIRNIRRVRIWSRNAEHARNFASRTSREHGIPIETVSSVREAVTGAHIICTVTSSPSPVLLGRWLTPGAHINAVGASVPGLRELDSEAVVKSKLYTDRRESLYNEADDFRIPRSEGVIQDSHLVGEIGEILTGKAPARQSRSEITLFKSLGLAVEDLAAAYRVYTKAKFTDEGVWTEFNKERV